MFLKYETAVVPWHKSCKCSISLFSRQQEEQFLHTGIIQMSATNADFTQIYPALLPITHDIRCDFCLFACLFYSKHVQN